VDFLVRLGVNFIWIGVESKANVFEKTRGIDVKSLISELQNNGITVLASAILFMEHHNPETLEEDIDWAIDLESDLLQFMQFTPVPGTRLYKEYAEAGILLQDIPWQKQHGQDIIAFNHPHFSSKESHEILKSAFTRKYHTHGPGILNMAWTSLKGYRKTKADMEIRKKEGLAWDPVTLRYNRSVTTPQDPFMELRLERMKHTAIRVRPILEMMVKYAPNAKTAQKARQIQREFESTFGPMTLKERSLQLFVQGTAILESLRYKMNGVVMRQPPTLRREYSPSTAMAAWLSKTTAKESAA